MDVYLNRQKSHKSGKELPICGSAASLRVSLQLESEKNKSIPRMYKITNTVLKKSM